MTAVGSWLIIPESTVHDDGVVKASCEVLRTMLAQQAITDRVEVDMEQVAFTLFPDTDERRAIRQAEVDAYAAEQGIETWTAPRIAILLGEAPARPLGPTGASGAS